MRTPAGTECPYYYEDFYRGRSKQECRLINRNPRSRPWEPKLCARCPVPDILRVNACPHMVLDARVIRRWFGLIHRVEVYAVCTEHEIEVDDPYVGCGRCHPEVTKLFEAAEVRESDA